MLYSGLEMNKKNSKFFSLVLVIADFAVLLAAFTIAYILRVQIDQRPLVNPIFAFDYLLSVLTILPIWIFVFAIIGLYSSQAYNRRLVEWSKIVIGCFIGILLIIGWEYLTQRYIFPARLATWYALAGSIVLVLFERELLRLIKDISYRYGRGVSRLLIIGDSAATRDIARELAETSKSGYHVVAIAGPKSVVPKHLDIQHFTDLDNALAHIHSLKINAIIQTNLYGDAERNKLILGAAQVHHVHYSFIPGEPEFYSGKNTVDVFLGYPMINVSQTPLIGWGAIVKRAFDLILTIVTLPLWGLLLLVIALLQKLFNPGPVFYKSTRLSQFSEPVTLYKFRSMGAQYGSKDAAEEFEEMGRADLAREYRTHHKVEKDPRITRFGGFLRDTSLDEFPQILNVLRGDISLVGPRPILPQEVAFGETKAALLHSVRSGMTGLWQVSGRSNLSFDERIELETFYAQNWTFWLDIKILIKTLGVVIRKTGAK